MTRDLVTRLASMPAAKERDRAVERVRSATEITLAIVTGVTQVSQSAMLGTLGVCMMKREASLLVPEDAAKFDLIATQAALGMAMQINRIAGL